MKSLRMLIFAAGLTVGLLATNFSTKLFEKPAYSEKPAPKKINLATQAKALYHDSKKLLTNRLKHLNNPDLFSNEGSSLESYKGYQLCLNSLETEHYPLVAKLIESERHTALATDLAGKAAADQFYKKKEFKVIENALCKVLSKKEINEYVYHDIIAFVGRKMVWDYNPKFFETLARRVYEKDSNGKPAFKTTTSSMLHMRSMAVNPDLEARNMLEARVIWVLNSSPDRYAKREFYDAALKGIKTVTPYMRKAYNVKTDEELKAFFNERRKKNSIKK